MDRGFLGGGPSSVRRDGAGELSVRIVQVAQTRYLGFTFFSPDAEAHSLLANGVIIVLTLLGHPFGRADASCTAGLAALLWLFAYSVSVSLPRVCHGHHRLLLSLSLFLTFQHHRTSYAPIAYYQASYCTLSRKQPKADGLAAAP